MLTFNPIQKVQFVLGVRKFEITATWYSKEKTTVEFFELGFEHKTIIRTAEALERMGVHFSGFRI